MKLQELVHTLLLDSDADTRRRAAEELIVSGQESESVIDAFVRGLSDVDKGVRDICAQGLVNTHKSFIAQKSIAVAALITHEDIEVRNLAGDVLIKLGDAAAEALYPYLSDSKADNRKFACDIIGLIGSHSNTQAIEKVGALLHDTDANVRCAAIEALGYLKADQYLEEIIIRASQEEDAVPYAITAAGNIGGERAKTFLLEMLAQGNPFLQMTSIDALAACGDDVAIANILIDKLADADAEIQLLLLKAVYTIAFRVNQALILPEEYRDIARKALMEDDQETRIAGLLALGPIFYDADIPALLHETKSNTPDTQKHILYVLLSRSSAATVEKFFHKLFDAISENCIETVELFGQLVSLWTTATPENASIVLDTVVRQYPNVSSDYQKEVVEFLLSVNREQLVKLLRNEIESNVPRRIEDAAGYIDMYSIRELSSILPTISS
jgi:HEAT repeat protein